MNKMKSVISKHELSYGNQSLIFSIPHKNRFTHYQKVNMKLNQDEK